MAEIAELHWAGRAREYMEALVCKLRNTSGTLGVLSFAVLVVLIAFVGIFLLPSLVEKYRLVHQLRQPITSKATLMSGASDREKVDSFRRKFPPSMLILSFVAQLNEFADASGVHIAQADFRPLPDPSGLTRYQAALTLRGNYISARKFLARSLTEIPVLAIDSLSMSRATSSDGLIDAQLRVSVYLAPE